MCVQPLLFTRKFLPLHLLLFFLFPLSNVCLHASQHGNSLQPTKLVRYLLLTHPSSSPASETMEIVLKQRNAEVWAGGNGGSHPPFRLASLSETLVFLIKDPRPPTSLDSELLVSLVQRATYNVCTHVVLVVGLYPHRALVRSFAASTPFSHHQIA